MIYENVMELIGETPLVKVCPSVHGLENITLYAKLEFLNPFGSLKDRVAWKMLGEALPDILAHDKRTLCCGGGDMALALQILSTIHGVECEVVTNRLRVPEYKSLLQFLGADIAEHLGLSEYPDPDENGGAMQAVLQRLEDADARYHYVDEATSDQHPRVHAHDTAPEISAVLKNVDYLVVPMGAGGCLSGLRAGLKKQNPNMTTIGVVAPHGDPIPGVRGQDDVQTYGLYGSAAPDYCCRVTADDAIDAMRVLARKCGILGGPASGAAFCATIAELSKIDQTLDVPQTAVFVAPDRLERFMTYIRTRRPELFSSPARTGVFAALHTADIERVNLLATEDAQKYMAERRPLVVDMRTPACYASGHIAGALNIPDGVLYDLLEQGRPFPKGAEILLVCARGNAARTVAAVLNKMGYDARVLDGGMMSWQLGQYPVEIFAAADQKAA